MVKTSNPRELQGAVVFQNKSCRNCHALDGTGGRRGPDLTNVGARLTRDLLVKQVSNGTPGGGDMPAYANQISPAEMAVLVDFLSHRRLPGETVPRTIAPAIAEVEPGR
jgi:ubiquinol-cytochrome c reductase cytochrome b subunit